MQTPKNLNNLHKRTTYTILFGCNINKAFPAKIFRLLVIILTDLCYDAIFTSGAN